jgi:hypothetical protein
MNARVRRNMKWLFQHPIHVLGWHLFGIPSVVLVDFDGETTVAFVRDHLSGGKYAMRMSFHITDVVLRANGKLVKHGYVDHWFDAPWNKGAVKIPE